MKPTVQIICITYNHEAFIGKALDSFVMQRTNFPFEAIIADDCSTDKTQSIIIEYSNKYPKIIKPILREKNIGCIANFVDALDHVTAEFVAICEGDDYWTDPCKLQKQVETLQKNNTCTVCFHPVCVHWEDGTHKDSIFPQNYLHFGKTVLNFGNLVKRNFIQTNSVMYRWRYKESELNFPLDILPCDWFLHLLHAQVGNIILIDEIMAVYRKWDGGLWAGAGTSDSWFCKCGVQHMCFYKAIKKHFPKNCTVSTLKMLRLAAHIYYSANRAKQFDTIRQLREKFPIYSILARYAFPFILLEKINLFLKELKLIIILRKKYKF